LAEILAHSNFKVFRCLFTLQILIFYPILSLKEYDMIDIISSAPLFKGLHPEVISGIVENANERQFTTGQIIIRQGASIKGIIYNYRR